MGYVDHGRRPRSWPVISSLSPASATTPEKYFFPFLITFIVLFATTGIGNGSTFRMIPIIFSKEQAGPVSAGRRPRRLRRLLYPQDFRDADQSGYAGIRPVRICPLLRELPDGELVVLRPPNAEIKC